MTFDVYRERFTVTEYRDGCVYRTRSEGYEWVAQSVADSPPTGTIYASPSLAVVGDMVTIRTSKDAQ